MSRAEGKKAEKSYFPSRPRFGIEAVNQNQTFAAKPSCMKNPSPIKVVKKFELSGGLSVCSTMTEWRAQTFRSNIKVQMYKCSPFVLRGEIKLKTCGALLKPLMSLNKPGDFQSCIMSHI